MTDQEPESPTPALQEEDLAVLKLRTKNEAHLTSNLGYGNAKKRELEVFNTVVWPRLTEEGWCKVKGSGDKVGSVFFLPTKDANIQNGRRGKDYYTRIRDVIDRVLQRRNDAETKIADAYQNEMNADAGDEIVGEASTSESSPPARRLRPVRNTRIDLSWKEGGSAFPRTSSRVGEEYQAVNLPSSDTFEKEQGQGMTQEEEGIIILYDQVWDPSLAESSGMADHVSQNIKYNLREAAMAAAHESGYDKDKLSRILSKRESQDGSNWTDEEKAQFRIEIFQFRKDLSAVAKSMNKSVNSCMTYYLNNFKKSDDYRLLKTLRAEERADKMLASEHGVDACGVCGDGGSLLICDGCEGEFHMHCLKPCLANIPTGRWECDDCVNEKFLQARDNLIRNTRLFERVPIEESLNRKRKAHDMESDGVVSDEQSSASSKKEYSNKAAPTQPCEIALRPTPQALEAVKKLALAISQALDESTDISSKS